jgi:hypothetical protein
MSEAVKENEELLCFELMEWCQKRNGRNIVEQLSHVMEKQQLITGQS